MKPGKGGLRSFFIALISLFSAAKWSTVEVTAWIGSPKWFRSCRSPLKRLLPQRTSHLNLYEKRGGKDDRWDREKKDSRGQSSKFFFNTTGLFYMKDDGVDLVVTNNITQPSSPLKENNAGIAAGTFGDIMSPTIDDANLLFQDGLVTSETYSLEGTYGISNPLDRMAVTANGNLQRLFSSYYDAPVEVEMVHCIRRQERLECNDTRGREKDEAAVWDRRVRLKIFGDQIFCTADSIVMVHSREVEDLVESGKVGIGQIFRHFNILPEFTLLAAGPTTKGGFWRNYTLESDLVTCCIHEVFCEGVWQLSQVKNEEDGN